MLLTPLLLSSAFLIAFGKKYEYDPVMCDLENDKDGQPFDDTICLVKDPDTNSRQMLLIAGLKKRAPPQGNVVHLDITKPGRGGPNSKILSLSSIPNDTFSYHGEEFRNGPHYINGKADMKFLSLKRRRGGGEQQVLLKKVKPVGIGDDRVKRSRTFVSVTGDVKLERFSNMVTFDWRISYKNQEGEWSSSSITDADQYIVKSVLDNFHGTFYDLDTGRSEHVVMLATFLDKTIVLVRGKKYELLGELYDDRVCIVDINRNTEVLLVEGLRTGQITASVLPTNKTDQKDIKLFTLPGGAYRGYLLGQGPHEIDLRASTVAFNSELITGKKANLHRVQEVFASDDRVASDEDLRSGREFVWTDGNVKVEQKSRHETFYSEKREGGNWTQMIEMQRWEYILSVPGLPFKGTFYGFNSDGRGRAIMLGRHDGRTVVLALQQQQPRQPSEQIEESLMPRRGSRRRTSIRELKRVRVTDL
ncbi:hypothetical protein FOZ63_005002 [Perkinsus olseni]|uniref:Uncharacterized protein n=1 Tax=Perkinsus olseni TaxID=32597 RepID=A0A7J6TAV9_PEROL|nr:hypothetical protein FOZ63_005002 [Perkinsus olseni]KAF4742213.1 hypothetical protein FOZ62_003205 [Perkinsus olseni]